ncbi:H-NS family nucleoid-associated regulatory protein [Caldimonas tepidiphila]|uniref:H-NS family nucleoid-associated regulatory protein n=1 Tax=Caldimonas tepidiphila TaxID=2315841 RepID=UPI001F0CA71D|nr:H-NS family nucleoid-associated regulatory protein [Caldimonas tepidiphila]
MSNSVEMRDPVWEARRRAALNAARTLVEFWGITPEQIARAPAPKIEQQEHAPRYRHPVHGHTWDGEGSQPQWLKDALIREGYTVEELRVAPQGANADH